LNFDIRSFEFVSACDELSRVDFGFRISSFERRLKPLLLVCLAVVGVLVTGCAHLSPDLTASNAAPFYHIQTNEDKENRRIDAAGPFYSQSESPEEKEWSLRPFFWFREDRKNQIEEMEFLYPLGWYKKTPKEYSLKFLPFYQNRKKVEEEEERSRDYVDLFPFFWGQSRSGEPFGGFFPLGGVFRDRFSRDEIQYAHWPLYTHIREGETETTHLLWPVFSFTGGGNREGFRLWPLYGREVQQGEGAYEKTFFLWPLGHYQQRYLDTETPKTYVYLLPLYARENSANENRIMVLWPFIQYYTESQFKYLQVDIPWPFVQYARGENTVALKLWPLITYRKVDDREKSSLLWPLFSQDKEEDEFKEEVLQRFLLVSKIHQKYWKKEDRWERVTKFWPLFRYAEDGKGLVHFFFPAVMPADWEGLERHYGLLFRVFDHYEDGRGLEITKFLWGLFYRQKQKDLERIEIGFLFDWQKTPDKLEVNFLKGLWGYRREGGKKTIKLFYLPVPLEEEPPARTENLLPGQGFPG
jgi:hypothetical protein